MNKKEPSQEEARLQEFNRRIKNYDTLNFLAEANSLLSIMTAGKRQIDQDVIAEVTGIQLRSLPLVR